MEKDKETTSRTRVDSTGSAHSDDGMSSPNSSEYEEGRPRKLSGGRVRSMSTGSAGGFEYGRKILLALDSSDNAKIAFEWYLNNVHRQDDYLVLVHIPEAPRLPTFSFKSGIGPPVDEWKKILDEMNARTRKLEEDYEGTCITKKLKYKIRGEAMKNPGEGILKIAEEEKCDIICMGTRGLGGVKRAFLGSVSDFVVRNCVTPVILVPGVKMRQRRLSQMQQTSVEEEK